MKARIYLTAALAIMAMQQDASAHALLDHSSPKAGEAVSDLPKKVTIWFDDDVTDATTIQVFDSDDKEVDAKDSKLDDKDKSEVTVTLPTAARGKYLVRWKAICTDGHTTTGKFSFTIKNE